MATETIYYKVRESVRTKDPLRNIVTGKQIGRAHV